MRDDDALAEAEQALMEGRLERARELVDAILARKPHHGAAREMRREIEELEAFREEPAPEAPMEAAGGEELGDLQPDRRHLERPAERRTDDANAAARERARRPDGLTPIPPGVMVLASIDLVIGALVAVLGVVALAAGAAGGLLAVALGAGLVVAGMGLWKLRAWAWTLALGLAVISVLTSGIRLAAGDAWGAAGIALNAGIAVYLWLVADAFPGARGRAAPG